MYKKEMNTVSQKTTEEILWSVFEGPLSNGLSLAENA